MCSGIETSSLANGKVLGSIKNRKKPRLLWLEPQPTMCALLRAVMTNGSSCTN